MFLTVVLEKKTCIITGTGGWSRSL